MICIHAVLCYNVIMKIRAFGKINLTLDVLFKRQDGYHELESIMHSVDIWDDITLEKGSEISLSSNLPAPEMTAAMKAARLFKERTGFGGSIHIATSIPSEAGLGSASADAAGVLKGLNRLYGDPIPMSELMEMGLSIGADVPFCILGSCALAQGVGEKLSPLPHMNLDLLIVKGSGGISTKELFTSLSLPVPHVDTAKAVQAVKEGNAAALLPHCTNALEDAATNMLPEIAQNKQKLLSLGAKAAFMTGSGSAVVGIFESREAVEKAREAFGEVSFARVCRTIGESI